MRMRFFFCLTLIATLVAGCTGGLKEQVRVHEERMEALSQQVARLEEANLALQTSLNELQVLPAPAKPSSATPSTNLVVTITPEIAEALAARINDLVMARVESTVDQRIATKVGTADDIEAIFSEVVVQEIDAREEAERREREQRRMQQVAERDTRSVQRRLEELELTDARQQEVLAARQAMRDQLDQKLAILRQEGSTTDQLMAAVADERVRYETQLAEILDEEEFQAYFTENH